MGEGHLKGQYVASDEVQQIESAKVDQGLESVKSEPVIGRCMPSSITGGTGASSSIYGKAVCAGRYNGRSGCLG